MTSSYSGLARTCRLGGIAALTVGAGLFLPASGANAADTPSASAVKRELEKLNQKVDQLANHYNKAKTELAAAKKRLAVANNELTTEQTQYQSLRVRVAQIAVAAYKNGTLDTPTFIASKDPRAALAEMSAFTKLSDSRRQEMTALLGSAQRLRRDQEDVQMTLQSVTTTAAALKKQKATVEKAIARQKALLAKISTPSRSTTSSGSSNSGSTTATTAAQKAVNYAVAQLGKPYIFGGEGPTGFDCSGLTMMAWNAAGVDLPRIVPDQYNAIRHVAKSDLQPGDLVFFDDLGHEGIYVGGGRFIHAPHTGTDVQYASISNTYWVSHYVGAGRP